MPALTFLLHSLLFVLRSLFSDVVITTSCNYACLMTFTAFLFRDIHPDESLMVDAGENVGVVLNFYNS